MIGKITLNQCIISLTLKYLVALILFLTSNLLPAQENKNSSELANFTITIENTDNGIKLQSTTGSAWKELSFTLRNDQPQAVDEFGMTSLDNTSAKVDPNFTRFLFTITKTGSGIQLKGIEGTSWTDLSFSLGTNETQTINELGMTK